MPDMDTYPLSEVDEAPGGPQNMKKHYGLVQKEDALAKIEVKLTILDYWRRQKALPWKMRTDNPEEYDYDENGEKQVETLPKSQATFCQWTPADVTNKPALQAAVDALRENGTWSKLLGEGRDPMAYFVSLSPNTLSRKRDNQEDEKRYKVLQKRIDNLVDDLVIIGKKQEEKTNKATRIEELEDLVRQLETERDDAVDQYLIDRDEALKAWTELEAEKHLHNNTKAEAARIRGILEKRINELDAKVAELTKLLSKRDGLHRV